MAEANGGMDDRKFQQRAEEIERLAQRAQAIPDPEARSLVQQLMQAVLSLHGDCLEHLLAVIEAEQPALLDRFAREPIVNALLALYGLHPESLEARVRGSLDKIRPFLQSHGGDVELLDVTESTVRVRLTLKGHACGFGALQEAVERSIYESAPEVAEIVAERPEPAARLVQLR